MKFGRNQPRSQGKGLIDLPSLGRGIVKASEPGTTLFEEQFAALFSEDERRLRQFIANSFTRGGEQIEALRRSTGLRRVGR